MTMSTPSPDSPQTGPLPGDAAAAGAGTTQEQEPPDPPVRTLVQALMAEWGLAVHDRLRLLMLEVRQAGVHATQMVLLATLAALMLCGAWTTLMVGLYVGCTQYGLHWALALALVLVLHVALAALAWLKAMALSTALTLPASLRVLKSLVSPPAKP